MIFEKIKKNKLRIIFFLIFSIIFIIILLVFTSSIALITRISPLVLIGITIIIGVAFFSLANLKTLEENKPLVEFSCISENVIKILLVGLIWVFFFIPIASNSTVITDWPSISPLLLIKGIIIILACSFLPGACLYKILFSKIELEQKLDVDPLIIKFLFYPILSFVSIGITVSILERANLSRTMFPITLLLIITSLLIIDLLIQKKNKVFTLGKERVSLSRYSIIILFLISGFICVSIGIYSVAHYIRGDTWRTLRPAVYIGTDIGIFDNLGKNYATVYFWSQIIFGLSVLSNIPYMNTNVILMPFSYLTVLSIYIFMKAILINKEEIYSIISTILILISSELTRFLINEFIYKAFSYQLIFVALALILVVFQSTEWDENFTRSRFMRSRDFKILILGATLLLISYTVYMITLLAGICILFIFFLFSNKKEIDIQILTILLIFFILIFFLLDIITNFFLSNQFIKLTERFFLFFTYVSIHKVIITYIIFIGAIIFFVIFQSIYPKLITKFNTKRFKSEKILKISYILLILGFSLLLLLYLYYLILSMSTDIFNNSPIAFYINLIMTNFGILGILGIYFSYYCYKSDKRFLFFLFMWISFFIFFASILIFKAFILDYPLVSPNQLPKDTIKFMHYWFRLLKFFFIPGLIIFASIGIIEIAKIFRDKKIRINKNTKKIITLSIIAGLIMTSSFNLYKESLKKGATKAISDKEANVIGWVADNIPDYSKILVESTYYLEKGIKGMLNCEVLTLADLFSEDVNLSEGNEIILDLKENEFKYAVFFDEHYKISKNVSEFVDLYLIEKFYNKSIYEYQTVTVYYAPFFD